MSGEPFMFFILTDTAVSYGSVLRFPENIL
jgi:hypothetical protein